MKTYNHPTYGELPLVVHPNKPWRLVAYYQGRAVYETDMPSQRGGFVPEDQELVLEPEVLEPQAPKESPEED